MLVVIVASLTHLITALHLHPLRIHVHLRLRPLLTLTPRPITVASHRIMVEAEVIRAKARRHTTVVALQCPQ